MISQHTPPHRYLVRRGCAALTGALALALMVACAPEGADVEEPAAEPASSAQSPTAEDTLAEGSAAADDPAAHSPAADDPAADNPAEDPANDAASANADRDSPDHDMPPEDEEDLAQPEPVALGQGAIPERVEIPGIDVAEDLIDLGLQADGTMEVPTDWDRAGWFTGGSRPGGPGATVIAGHVDSPTGPAVFFRLTELDVGDRVEITDVDGALHHYEVYRIEDLPKDDYPTHIAFGATPDDELRLVTCTGEFDGAAQRHLDNRVVFARAIAP